MALDLWFREDVARILTALAAAGSERGPEYHKALFDVGLAFGLHIRSVRESAREEVETAYSLVRNCTRRSM
jgi:hypothetical protein